MNIPIKVEIFSYENEEPYYVKHYSHPRETVRKPEGFFSRLVEVIQEDYRGWLDFPTGERLAKVLITNNQESYTKLYLDEQGNTITRFKFSREG